LLQNSPSAFNTSLEEILEVFKQLHVNDGAQSIPPFWLYLSLQPKPSSYLTMLKQAAAGGQGISSFVDVPAEEVPADFGEYYQDGDEDPTLLGDASGVDYDDQQHNDGQDAVAEADINEADYHEYDTSYENTEGGQEAQQDYEQYEQYDDAEQAEYEDYGEGEETNTPTAHVEDPENVQPSGETADPSRTDTQDAEIVSVAKTDHSAPKSPSNVTEKSEVHGEGEVEEQGEGSNVESVASSTTLRADQANDAVGEYKHEDLIVWDDSILTSDRSEHGTDDNDDFSTFLTEPDLEENELEAPEGEERDTAAFAEQDVGPEHRVENTDSHTQGVSAAEINSQANGLSRSLDEVEKQEDVLAAVEIPTGEDVSIAEAEQTEEQASEHNDLSRDTTQAQVAQHQHQVQEVEESAHNDEDYIDFGEDENIDFDDDTYEQHEARKASQANSPGSLSPTGKRPLDVTDGSDFTDQPDLKKVKSS
jgi:hypothetical protein